MVFICATEEAVQQVHDFLKSYGGSSKPTEELGTEGYLVSPNEELSDEVVGMVLDIPDVRLEDA